jgi:acetyl/propionyl-CoA carboxylase alpha subunit
MRDGLRIGDRTGAVTLVGERECTLQRRHQKLIEVAPSPSLSTELREHLCEATRRLAAASGYDNLGTFEFLLDGEETNGEAFAFIEANPRLQVEHTVTEEVFGIDLVRTQIELAGGRTLAELGLTQADVPAARGFAVQLRINLETMDAAGSKTVNVPPVG